MAEISGGESSLPLDLDAHVAVRRPATTLYGTILLSSLTSANLRPMNRLMEKMVFSGLVTACRFATWPTSRSPSFANATTDGVVRPPSAFGDDDGIAAFHDGDDRVGGSEVDSDDLAQVRPPRP